MGVELLHHVQLAMTAGSEALARGFHAGLPDITEVCRPTASAARLRAMGYECCDHDEFKDFKRMFIFDPFCNRLELLEPRATLR